MTILKTKRLILRPWREDDFGPFAKLNSDERMMRYLPSISREESDQRALEIKKKIEKEGWGRWAVSLHGSDKFIGTIGLYYLDFNTFAAPFTPAFAIGWKIAVDHWNKGYATEGAKAVLKYGFERLKLEEIVAFCAKDNGQSRRVMEKIGMHCNPKDDFNHPKIPSKNNLCRQVLYRISKTEWEKQERNPAN